uniref:Si:dkey-86e18.1 n=1 Tax=Poecilia formosa TaxID=48698 RepID=A0A096LRG9_POEFO
MARNEEKQQGRLNRLWLQKEREEGRLKDVNKRRPKLSTLNSAPSVKKWIPSIKSEIEYYLQQSQLPHYPERKIAEFQLHIEALEKEYKSFISKLRALDPSCKHKPWTPRAYSKRRGEAQNPPNAGKKKNIILDNVVRHITVTATSSDSRVVETRLHSLAPTGAISDASSVQDQPLSFDRTRLAVAAAAFRGPALRQSSSQTQNLARMLQSGLPNLSKFHSQQTENNSSCAAASDSGLTEDKSGHILGLDCYSSSDEDTN